MTPWRAHTLLFLTVCIVTSAAWGDESITFSVNLVVDETEATSIGRATYQAPSLCLDCRHGDGAITPRDGIWGRIRLWVDTNHDGAMSRDEDYSLASRGVVALPLAYEQFPIDDPAAVDASGNVHFQQGAFTQRLLGHGERLVRRRAHCVMFRALFR